MSHRFWLSVNYAANQSQCYVQIPFDQFRGRNVRMKDLLDPIVYESKCDESRGLYLDLRAWGYHVFELSDGRFCHGPPLPPSAGAPSERHDVTASY